MSPPWIWALETVPDTLSLHDGRRWPFVPIAVVGINGLRLLEKPAAPAGRNVHTAGGKL